MTESSLPAQVDVRRAAFRFIVCIGLVSLFADMTYEGAYSGIGPFLNDLGVGAAMVGFISGFGEMIAASLRYFSGKLADRTRAYWPLVDHGLRHEPVRDPRPRVRALVAIGGRAHRDRAHGQGNPGARARCAAL